MTALSNVTTSLERAWAAIRTRFPDVGSAAVVVYLPQAADRKGHYWRRAWETRTCENLDEIFVSSAVLGEGADATMHVLVHEAVHSACATCGLQDTSRQGRYHNQVFAERAREMGLVVVPCADVGCTTLALTDEARRWFVHAIEDIWRSLDLWQLTREGKTKKPRPRKRYIALVCPTCGRIVRVTRTDAAKGAIVCVPCKDVFVKAGKGTSDDTPR